MTVPGRVPVDWHADSQLDLTTPLRGRLSAGGQSVHNSIHRAPATDQPDRIHRRDLHQEGEDLSRDAPAGLVAEPGTCRDAETPGHLRRPMFAEQLSAERAESCGQVPRSSRFAHGVADRFFVGGGDEVLSASITDAPRPANGLASPAQELIILGLDQQQSEP
jgi:hypothetical protein